MAIRQAMAKIDLNTVYFPEPKTIFKMHAKDPKAVAGTFTSAKGTSEGQSLVADMRKQLSLKKKDMVFDLRAAIETNNDRFAVKIGGTETKININWIGGKITHLTAGQIKALFSNSQTHALKLYWERRMVAQYPGEGKVKSGRGAAIINVYEHYFPNELIGYEPEELKKQLKTYISLSNYGENALLKETKENLQATKDYESVISIAEASGKAAQNFLIEVLGIE
jgi:hypothetical protein